MKDLNRIKVVLVEKKRTNKWLAEQLGKDPATISKWCTNSSQPDLATLLKVANLLEVDVKDLLNSSKEEELPVLMEKFSATLGSGANMPEAMHIVKFIF